MSDLCNKPELPRRRLRRLIRIALSIALAVPIVLYAVFLACVAWWPYPAEIEKLPPAATWISDRNGAPLAAFVAPDGHWRMPLSRDQISPHLLIAIVATEDAGFHKHSGTDWCAAAAAGWQDMRSLSLRRGASTITMQLHRLRDPLPRNCIGKLEQIIRAAQIERQQSKEQILIEYLNRAPFGGNLVGAGAASWRYFGRACRDLSLGQAALLAGLPKNPNHYRPDRFPQCALARRAHVLARMLQCGMITAQQFADALQEPLDASWRALPQLAADNTIGNGALATLLRLNGASSSISIDAGIQRQVFTAAREQLEVLSGSGVAAAAIIVLDNETGQCLASLSLCPDDRRIDLTRCARSTGSVIKPLIYAAAFEAGVCTPATILRDSPAAWPGYAPQNYDHAFRGWMTAAAALAESRNIPALQVLAQLGVQRAAAVCGTAGLRTVALSPQRYGVSLAIGGAEATPLEMAEAYSTLARGGLYLPATFTTAEKTSALRSISEEACWKTIAALNQPQRTEGICPQAARLRVAWKTGTSSGHRDAWCAAITRSHTIVVWLGNLDGRGSTCLVGADAAAPLALRLIAGIQPETASWPVAATLAPAAADATAPSYVSHRRQLTILSPSDGAQIIRTSDSPAVSQRILLRAVPTRGPDRTFAQPATLWWFVDGQPLGTTRDDDQIWWPPVTGSHVLRVVDEQGIAAQIRFSVR